MEQVVPDSNEQSLSSISSPTRPGMPGAMRQVARGSSALLGGNEGTLLIIDESGIPKKGKHSAGVARLWCGAQLHTKVGQPRLTQSRARFTGRQASV
jgi:SRSO17 transposase